MVSIETDETTTGLTFWGCAASEATDSSGEKLLVDGIDISDFENGVAQLNWEHENPDDEDYKDKRHPADEIVGRILTGYKVFKESDCRNEYDRKQWKNTQLPFVAVVCRLYDGAGHPGAVNLAAIMRDHAANGEKVLARLSIEGSTLTRDENDKNKITSSVAKMCAITIKPCNRVCDVDVLLDPNAPKGFNKEPGADAKDILAEVVQDVSKSEVLVNVVRPDRMRMPAVEFEIEPVAKALTAGGYSVAPSSLTDGSALQTEDKSFKNRLRRVVEEYSGSREPFNKAEFVQFAKASLPDVGDGFIDHFSDIAHDFYAKRSRIAKAETPEAHPTAVRRIPNPYADSKATESTARYFKSNRKMSERQAFDYSHVLPEERTRQGYRLTGHHHPARGIPAIVELSRNGQRLEHTVHDSSGTSLYNGVLDSPARDENQWGQEGHMREAVDEHIANASRKISGSLQGINDTSFLDTLALQSGEGRPLEIDKKRAKPVGPPQADEGTAIRSSLLEVSGLDEKPTNVSSLPPPKYVGEFGDENTGYRKMTWDYTHHLPPELVADGWKLRARHTPGEHSNYTTMHAYHQGEPRSMMYAYPNSYHSPGEGAAPRFTNQYPSQLQGAVRMAMRYAFGQHEKLFRQGELQRMAEPSRFSLLELHEKDLAKAAKAAKAGEGEIQTVVISPQRLTVLGKPARSTTAESTVFDEKTGTLHVPATKAHSGGQFKVYLPHKDKDKGASFNNILNDPEITKAHDYAVKNWARVNKMLKDGTLPPEILMHATLFSNLSPKTKVPMQELMHAHLVDSINHTGIDARHPEFAEVTGKDWLSRDQADKLPTIAAEHWEKPYVVQETRIKGKTASRPPGSLISFMLANSKLENMSKYQNYHKIMEDIVRKNGGNVRQSVADLLAQKQAGVLGGLSPKTIRYLLGMVGGGNVHVPDTHFVRHIFGMDKDLDSKTLDIVKRAIWDDNPKKTHVLDAIDRYYAKHHPAVQHMLSHPAFGGLFESPEDAIFPAFWKHWIAITPHERARGLNAYNSANEGTDHMPYWRAIEPFLKSEEADWSLPSRTATLHNIWVHKYGEMPALMMYYAHLVPKLLAHHAQHAANEAMVKTEALLIDLRKSVDDIHEALPDMVAFRGRRVVPGVAFTSRGKHALLHEDDTHYIAVPYDKRSDWDVEDLKKFPKTKEGTHFWVTERPTTPVHGLE